MSLFNIGIHKTKDDFQKAAQQMMSLTGRAVLVGIPADKADRQKEAQKQLTKLLYGKKKRITAKKAAQIRHLDEMAQSPMNNATLLAIHENGSELAGIPPRPVLHPGINSARKELTERMRAVGIAALEGNKLKVERGLNAVGLAAQAAVRRYMNQGVPPPLKKSTIAARRRRGRTGTKPLIDTAQLRNAINYVVR